MAVLCRDGLVAERVTFDGKRQREALGAFQKAAGLEATAVALAVGLSYPQYNRYLWGRLPLRTDQIQQFASAYGVSKAELTRALGLLDDCPEEASAWTMRDALRGQLPEDLIDQQVERWAGSPIDDQRAACIDLIAMYQDAVREASQRMLKQQRRDRPA